MNNCTFVGKIFKIEDKGDKNNAKAQLRIGFRKRYVSDEDKKAGKTLTFIGASAFGQTADFILKNFDKDDMIGIACQYDPFENKDGDEVPWFNVTSAAFVGGGNGGSNKKDDEDDAPRRGARNSGGSRSSRRDDSDDNDRGRGSRGSRRRDDEEPEEDEAPRRRGGRRDDAEDDGSPF